jgi:hypothetical protein
MEVIFSSSSDQKKKNPGYCKTLSCSFISLGFFVVAGADTRVIFPGTIVHLHNEIYIKSGSTLTCLLCRYIFKISLSDSERLTMCAPRRLSPVMEEKGK